MINQELWLALQRPILSDAGKRALDALVQAGKNDVRFRQALIDHKDFWRTLQVPIPNGQNPNAADFLDRIPQFHRLVVQKRISVGLKEASEQQLSNLIAKNNTIAIVTELANDTTTFGNYTNITGELQWDVNTQTVIDDDLARAIHREARRTLLLKKIEASEDLGLINDLLRANNPDRLHAAAVALGVPDGAPGFQEYVGAVAPHEGLIELQNAAARKGIILQINSWTEQEVADAGFDAINNDDINRFRARFAPPASNWGGFVVPADLNKMKGVLGARVISQLITTNPATKPDLTAIAAETNVQNLKDRLNKEPYRGGGDGTYLAHAINEQTIASIRLAAANQVLKQAIPQCKDIPALEALVRVTNANELKQVLENYPSLQFSGNTNFQSAFDSATDFDDFIAAAHVQKSLVEAEDLEQLKNLALNPADFAQQYKDTFASNATDEVRNALDQYFADAANKNAFRKEALSRYVKPHLSDPLVVNDAHLAAMVGTANAEALHPVMTAILGSDEANDLIRAHDSGIGLELRQYAAAEKAVRDAKALNLYQPEDLNALKEAINAADFNQRQPEAQLLQGLSSEEKNALRVRLVEVLISNYQITSNSPFVHLTNLGNAKDMTEFCQALNAMGINELGWRSEEARTTIQKAAFQTAIQQQIGMVSHFGEAAHPELLALVKTFDFEKQKALFQKPAVLRALLEAQDEYAVARILGDDSINAEALINENKKLWAIAKIQNSVVAEILANVQPTVDLTEDNIRAINNIVNAPPPVDPLTPENYAATVNAILDHTGPNRRAIAIDFGLQDDVHGVIQDDRARADIQGQRNHNQGLLYTPFLHADPAAKAVRDLCLCLDKQDYFTVPATFAGLARGNEDFAKFYQDFKASNSLKEFFAKVDAPNNTYRAKLAPNWKQQLTPQIFNEVKQQIYRQGFRAPDPRRALTEQKRRIDPIEQLILSIETSNDDIHRRLRRLAATQSIEWLNPAFQAAARQNGKRMEQEFRDLATHCDLLITQSRHQIDVLNREINSLPSIAEAKRTNDPEYIQAITARREMLLELLRKANRTLSLYEPVQKLLKGNPKIDANINPLMHQGILKTLAEINAGKKDIRFLPFNTETVSYPLAEKDQHLAKGYVGRPARFAPVTMQAAGGTAYYETQDSIKPGFFREHTMTHIVSPGQANQATYTSNFIEERDADKPVVATRDNKGNVAYSPNIKLTASQFPQEAPRGQPGLRGNDLVQARIEYSMAMATQLLAGMAGAPSEKNKIRIGGHDPVAMKYLWTALMVLGEDPNMRFGAKAIEVVSTAGFDPAAEQGRVMRYSDNSLYEEHFRGNPKVRMLRNALAEVNKNKVEGKSELEGNMGALTAHYRKEVSKQMLQDVKDKNQKDDETPTLIY